MKICISPVVVAIAVALMAPLMARAQTPQERELDKAKKTLAGLFAAKEAEILEVAPLVAKVGVRNAPFTADAVTEFTQILGDGNRIERRFTASIARDSQGRTRREQEVAMIGPLASLQGQQPQLIVISDPATGSDYTLDERTKTAVRQFSVFQIRDKLVAADLNLREALKLAGAGAAPKKVLPASEAPSKVVSEQLGTRQMEGVTAEGNRTTITFDTGTLGNVSPIDIVTERWFSKELQMELLISRRDPRSGDTVYRLTNIVRAEPPPDLFVVPPGYTIESNGVRTKKIELDKLNKVAEALRRKGEGLRFK